MLLVQTVCCGMVTFIVYNYYTICNKVDQTKIARVKQQIIFHNILFSYFFGSPDQTPNKSTFLFQEARERTI